MIPFLREENKTHQLKRLHQLRRPHQLKKLRIKMILMLSQYWKSAAAVIAYVQILSLKDILAVSVCQLNAVPSQLVSSH